MSAHHIADRQFLSFVRDASLGALRILRDKHPYISQWKRIAIDRAILRKLRVA